VTQTPKRKKKTIIRRQPIKRAPSPSSHVIHYNIGSDIDQKPKCRIKNAQLFTKDKRIFLEPMYAFRQKKQPCEFCRRRLEKERHATR